MAKRTDMNLDLNTILPNIGLSLDGSGFMFGAGTSVGAGYPAMTALTKDVIGQLTVVDRAMLDQILAAEGSSYDDAAATPNIEQLADTVLAYRINSGKPEAQQLEDNLRELVVAAIVSVEQPALETHVRFFEALKRRAFGRPCTVWIFTTNYDLLFEIAAARAGVILENGFSGAIERFFDPANFDFVRCSRTQSQQYALDNQLTIKLVKLHGSISWVQRDTGFFEMHPDAIDPGDPRILVLPRRGKVMDTLHAPHDALFAYTNKILGGPCKYLVSCGFSFGDDHIKQHLIVPALKTNKCRMFALNRLEPDGVADLKQYPSFHGGFSTHLHLQAQRVDGTTDLWDFKKLVDALYQ